MKLEVIYTQWAAEGQVFPGGVHDDVKVTRKLAPLLAAAEAAGAVVVLEASQAERKLLRPHVQSQADGEKAYAVAQHAGSLAREAALEKARKQSLADQAAAIAASGENWAPDESVALAAANAAVQADTSWAAGTWHEGNLQQFELDVASGARKRSLDG